MKFDVLGLLAACSYALDCVEAELIKVTNNHSKRVAYIAVCTAEKNGYTGSKPAGSGRVCIAARQAIWKKINILVFGLILRRTEN